MSTASLDTLNILPSAIARTYELLALENNFDLNLRVYVEGGGCSGFKYSFEFNSDVSDTDLVINKFYNPKTKEILLDSDNSLESFQKVSFVVDPISFNYLCGSNLDYVNDLKGSRYKIENPNALATCSCGSSFTVEGA